MSSQNPTTTPSKRKVVVFSGGSAANSLVDVFNEVIENNNCTLTYVIPISDNGGSSSELIRVFGGPGIGDVRSMKSIDVFVSPLFCYHGLLSLSNVFLYQNILHLTYFMTCLLSMVSNKSRVLRPSCSSDSVHSRPYPQFVQSPSFFVFRTSCFRVSYFLDRHFAFLYRYSNASSDVDSIDSFAPSP